MRFSDILGLQEYFQPVFNMENETGNYWKQFIPNENFYEILNKALLAVNSPHINDKLSLWLVGRYGTGKSHASSVIKHLLWDDFSLIEDYIENSINKPEIKQRLLAYRQKNRIFPVVIKGIGNITDAHSMGLEIEKAVKKSLNEKNIVITTKSSFEKIIDQINSNYLNWNTIIDENTDLKMYVSTKEEIIHKLKNENIELLNIIERILSKKNIHLSHEKISSWLKEISNELIKKNISSGLMIYWDEFTSVLEKETISEIINEIQSIAELSPKDNVYLYLISHRDYNQFGQNIQEILNKVKDRFYNLKYPLVPVTTYQILSAAIKKKDPAKWEMLKKNIFSKPEIENLINYITENTNYTNVKNSIKNLYPIHPYTVYLSTFLANNIGSTQRSIFNFLYDKEHGFIHFLNNEVNENTMLTADALWDFYANELERDNENRFMQILEKYNTYKHQILEENAEYLKVFKGVLLLNALSHITDYSNPETSKVIPNEKNIKNLFIGTEIEQHVDNALQYINDNEIVQKNPNNIYEISSTSLPLKEIEAEKVKLRNEYKVITDIIDYYGKIQLENFFNEENEILRKTRVRFFNSQDNFHLLKNNLHKFFQASYTLDFAVFVKLNNGENDIIDNLIAQLKQEDDFKNIIFVVIQEPFGEKNYKQFVEYLSRSNVFRNHSFNNESTKEEGFAKQIIDNWIRSINYVNIISNSTGKIIEEIRNLGNKINLQFSPEIFNKGVDKLGITTATVWKFQAAKKAIEYVLDANNRNDIENKPVGQYNYLKEIFKDKTTQDYIVDKHLNIKDKSLNHPVIHVSQSVKEVMKKMKNRPSFNLANELEFLTKPSFGLYTNILNMGLLGYAFRDFIDKLYAANSGQVIDKIAMRDKINEMFDCWQKNKNCDKLNVRLGSEEEKKLIKELAELFNISDYSGLQDIRWKIRAYIKEIGYPLWSINHIELKFDHLKEIISDINDSVFKLTDTEIDKDFITKLLSDIQANRFDLKQHIRKENFKKGFYNFIKAKANTNINDNEFEDVYLYIKQKQPEELNWDENGVENAILNYIIEKNNKNKEIKDYPDSYSNTSTTNENDISFDLVNDAKVKITNINDINELKQSLINFIDENPQISSILLRYL